jgi:uncharacterized protein
LSSAKLHVSLRSRLSLYRLTSDDFAGTAANQTNLALKAVVGIGAMSRISALVGHPADASRYAVRRIFGMCSGADMAAGASCGLRFSLPPARHVIDGRPPHTQLRQRLVVVDGL